MDIVVIKFFAAFFSIKRKKKKKEEEEENIIYMCGRGWKEKEREGESMKRGLRNF